MNQDNGVVLKDIDVPFGRAVMIMVKWILASIPAVLLAAIIGWGIVILVGVLGTIVGQSLG